MLSKKSYRQVVKRLEQMRLTNEADRKENPSRIPIDWQSSIEMMIEKVVRDNREPFKRGIEQTVIKHFVEKGVLTPYCGGYTFKNGEVLPTEAELRQKAETMLKRMGFEL